MGLIRWRARTEMDPFRNLMEIQDEINRLLDFTLGRRQSEHMSSSEGEWFPALDVYEDENKVVVRAELPGMTNNDVDVDILNNTLTIKGEKKKEEEKKEQSYHRIQRSYGAFQRSITLSTSVAAEKAKASFKNDVLEIEIPKKEEAKPKQIKIDVA